MADYPYWVDNGAGYRMPADDIEKARVMAMRLAKERDWASRRFGMKHWARGEDTDYDNAVPVYATRTGKAAVGYVVLERRSMEYWVTRYGRSWKYQDIQENGKLIPANARGFKPKYSDWDWTINHYRTPASKHKLRLSSRGY